MENMIIWQIAGFVVCFILLFVFIAKYHGAVEQEQDLQDEADNLEQETAAQPPVFASRAALLRTAQAPAALELADLKEQVKELHYHLQELKASTQKHEADMMARLSRMEQRLGTFEQEYVNKLQPTLLRVIEELEHIKVGEEASPAQPVAEQPAEDSAAHASPVPELPEEELKF